MPHGQLVHTQAGYSSCKSRRFVILGAVVIPIASNFPLSFNMWRKKADDFAYHVSYLEGRVCVVRLVSLCGVEARKRVRHRSTEFRIYK